MTAAKLNVKEKLKELVPWVTQACRLTPEESGKLEKSLAAEITVAVAFFSGCKEPARIAVSHLLTLVADYRTDGLFSHKAGESLGERLEIGNYFPGGDTEIVKAGKLILELLSLNDHKKDIARDILTRKQNPLIIDIDYQEEYNRIVDSFNNLPQYARSKFQILFDKSIKADIWIG